MGVSVNMVSLAMFYSERIWVSIEFEEKGKRH